MNRDRVREQLIDLIHICDNCVKLIDDNEEFLAHKVALRLSAIDIKLMRLAKELAREVK